MAKAPTYAALKDKYETLWTTMVIKSSWRSAAYRAAKAIYANKDKYEDISKLTNVPWYFIGLLHKLECDLDFTKHLHNGDSLARKTRRVPAGRPLKGNGPFSFNESAVDALTMKGFDKVTDWSYPHIAFMCEKYNGWGYYYKGKNSPYLWSGSNHYLKGKFVADHKYDPAAVSQQVGTMVILKALMDIAGENDPLDYKEAVKQRPDIKITERMDNFLTYLGLPGLMSLTFLKDVKEFATDHAAMLILGIGSAVFVAFKYLKFLNQDRAKKGRVFKPRKSV